MTPAKYQHLLDKLQDAIIAHNTACADYSPHCGTRSAALAKARSDLARARADLDAVKAAPNGSK